MEVMGRPGSEHACADDDNVHRASLRRAPEPVEPPEPLEPSRTMRSVPTLQELLVARTHDAAPELVETIDGGSTGKPRLRCYACGHRCPIPEGAMCVCKVRFN